MSLSLGNTNVSDIYYGATKITDAYLGSTHVYQSLKPITLTLCASEGGTLTATSITGLPGDTVTLSTAYNTYWRFSGYAKAGDGSISNNTYTFGEDDEQIVSAYYKKNAFTAIGKFNWTDWSLAKVNWGQVSAKSFNAILTGFTGSKPANWPNNNANWNVTNASAYKINAKTLCKAKKTNTGAVSVRMSAVMNIAGTRVAGLTSAVATANGSTTVNLVTLN